MSSHRYTPAPKFPARLEAIWRPDGLMASSGPIHLLRLAGIDVFLHWSWFAVAAFEISARGRRYPTIAWNIAEYLALFLIVTLS